MRNLIFLLLVVPGLCYTSCSKPEKDDLAGKGEIKGVLVLRDTLQGLVQETFLTDHIVQLKEAKDSSNKKFLYQVKTSSTGGFVFSNIDDKPYYIYAEKKSGDILFTASLPAPAGADNKITLYPMATDYNIISVIVKDSATGGLLKNASICVFKNKVQAEAGSCDLAVWKDTSNEYGRALKTRLAPGWYYINSSLTIGPTNFVKKDSIEIGATGIFSKTIYLNSDNQYNVTGSIYINDTLTGPAEEVPVASQVLVVKKLADTATQRIFQQVTTNAQGVFALNGLPAGKYWLQAEQTIDNITYRDTAILEGATHNVTMVLLPKATTYNVLQVITKDSANHGLLNNVQVCIFSSAQLAQHSVCEGSILADHSNQYAKTKFARLPPGKYYINAALKLDALTLSVRDSVELSATGIHQKIIYLK